MSTIFLSVCLSVSVCVSVLSSHLPLADMTQTSFAAKDYFLLELNQLFKQLYVKLIIFQQIRIKKCVNFFHNSTYEK
jgi:hypothetical protein